MKKDAKLFFVGVIGTLDKKYSHLDIYVGYPTSVIHTNEEKEKPNQPITSI